MVGIPAKIRESKKAMSEIRQSLFQKPPERIRSIKELNRMIAAPMSKLKLERGASTRQGKKLMSEANAEHRDFADECFYVFDCVIYRLRVSGAV